MNVSMAYTNYKRIYWDVPHSICDTSLPTENTCTEYIQTAKKYTVPTNTDIDPHQYGHPHVVKDVSFGGWYSSRGVQYTGINNIIIEN